MSVELKLLVLELATTSPDACLVSVDNDRSSYAIGPAGLSSLMSTLISWYRINLRVHQVGSRRISSSYNY